MYIPKQYQIEDRKKLISFIQTYNFAIVITIENNTPIATHLPFIIEERGEELYLLSHLAKANPQWKTFEQHENVLIIFSGPHAYVSPSHYEKLQNVPTWNYTAVHVYGKATLLENIDQKTALLEKSIQLFEPSYLKQWQQVATENNYREKMMNAIVAFEIKASHMQGKFKLSQNKTVNEQQNIVLAYSNSHSPIENELGAFMKKHNNL